MVLLRAQRYALPGLLLLAALVVLVAPRASVLRARAEAAITPSGEIARIEIPAIAVDSKVIAVRKAVEDGRRQWGVADYAVGHHAGSGAPGGDTNIVLSGHNNINGEVFRRLDELRRGDEIVLHGREGEARRYRVAKRVKVLQDGASRAQRRKNARFMRPTPRERLTLISCWPYAPYPPYRIIVLADPVRG